MTLSGTNPWRVAIRVYERRNGRQSSEAVATTKALLGQRFRRGLLGAGELGYFYPFF